MTHSELQTLSVEDLTSSDEALENLLSTNHNKELIGEEFLELTYKHQSKTHTKSLEIQVKPDITEFALSQVKKKYADPNYNLECSISFIYTSGDKKSTRQESSSYRIKFKAPIIVSTLPLYNEIITKTIGLTDNIGYVIAHTGNINEYVLTPEDQSLLKQADLIVIDGVLDAHFIPFLKSNDLLGKTIIVKDLGKKKNNNKYITNLLNLERIIQPKLTALLWRKNPYFISYLDSRHEYMSRLFTQKAAYSLLRNISLNLDRIKRKSSGKEILSSESISNNLFNALNIKVLNQEMLATYDSSASMNELQINQIKAYFINKKPFFVVINNQSNSALTQLLVTLAKEHSVPILELDGYKSGSSFLEQLNLLLEKLDTIFIYNIY